MYQVMNKLCFSLWFVVQNHFIRGKTIHLFFDTGEGCLVPRLGTVRYTVLRYSYELTQAAARFSVMAGGVEMPLYYSFTEATGHFIPDLVMARLLLQLFTAD